MDKPKVFIDANIFIAGLVSPYGGAATILVLAEANVIQLLTCKQVLTEAERNIQKKLPGKLSLYYELIKAVQPEIQKDPLPPGIKKAQEIINPTDAPILAAASATSPNYFVTLDRKHFADTKVRKGVRFKIVTPGEFLQGFPKAFWEPEEKEKKPIFTEKGKRLIRELQGNLPLVLKPFKEIAEKIGLTEAEVLATIKDWQRKGVIRRFGALLRHHQAGMKANVMVVWQVPSSQVLKIGKMMASLPKVSHCYERPSSLKWPYNLYTMIHGRTKKNCLEVVKTLVKKSGIKNYQLLFSVKELKRSTMEYF